jgi:ribonuclease T1
VVALLVALAFAGCGSDAAEPAATAAATTFARATTVTAPATSGTARATTTRAAVVSGLPTMRVAELPAEGRHTLALIEAGGPFPYSQDGAVFENRERLLPLQARGWYHEYTVPTPGEDDRGARRIITGQDEERYYTADHYESFRQVVGA